MADSTQMTGFPVVLTESIAWGEMDAYAHVNNTVYFRWFESARIAYLDKIGFRDPAANDGIAPILAATQCRFRIPLTYPGNIQVGARVTAVDVDRFTMEYTIIRMDGGVAAQGTGEIVSFDYTHGRKAALPDSVRERIRILESGA